ncbi:MAG TPA: nucleoside recognition domain-containing protein [Oscillospiraceae bacterium]|nr:nucleoside recognition domain-containing protein [Oscillospiraceae bacterium]
MDYWKPARQGLRKALRTTLLLAKIIIPVTFVIVSLKRIGIIGQLADLLAPFLKILGLPGEAALPLFLGFFVNIYAAIGAISLLALTGWQITIIAVMILTCHSLLMETPVLKLSGVHPAAAVLIRFGSAMILGFALHLLYQVVGVY